MILEALCRRCGETFNPADAEDLEHIENANGDPCGGAGDLQGRYLQDARDRARDEEVIDSDWLG